MTDRVHDMTEAQSAKDNIPTQSNPMDNIHGTTEDLSNKASGYKAAISNPNTSAAAKKEAEEQLKKLGGEKAFYGKEGKGE